MSNALLVVGISGCWVDVVVAVVFSIAVDAMLGSARAMIDQLDLYQASVSVVRI